MSKTYSQGMLYPSFKRVECPLHPSEQVVRVKGHDICPECHPGDLPLNRAARRRSFRRIKR